MWPNLVVLQQRKKQAGGQEGRVLVLCLVAHKGPIIGTLRNRVFQDRDYASKGPRI